MPSSVFSQRVERLGPVDQQGEVVIAGHGEAGVDDVVADALVAEVDFQAVVEEGEEVGCIDMPSAESLIAHDSI